MLGFREKKGNGFFIDELEAFHRNRKGDPSGNSNDDQLDGSRLQTADFHIRGAKWARPEDLNGYLLQHSDPKRAGRITLSKGLGFSYSGDPTLLAAKPHEHVMFFGKTGSGKTQGLIIPNILEWPEGGVFAYSTSPDVLDWTYQTRLNKGKRVHVFDPSGSLEGKYPTSVFAPLRFSKTPEGAQETADLIAGTSKSEKDEAQNKEYWKSGTTSVVEPLLYASANAQPHHLEAAGVDSQMELLIKTSKQFNLDLPIQILREDYQRQQGKISLLSEYRQYKDEASTDEMRGVLNKRLGELEWQKQSAGIALDTIGQIRNEVARAGVTKETPEEIAFNKANRWEDQLTGNINDLNAQSARINLGAGPGIYDLSEAGDITEEDLTATRKHYEKERLQHAGNVDELRRTEGQVKLIDEFADPTKEQLKLIDEAANQGQKDEQHRSISFFNLIDEQGTIGADKAGDFNKFLSAYYGVNHNNWNNLQQKQDGLESAINGLDEQIAAARKAGDESTVAELEQQRQEHAWDLDGTNTSWKKSTGKMQLLSYLQGRSNLWDIDKQIEDLRSGGDGIEDRDKQILQLTNQAEETHTALNSLGITDPDFQNGTSNSINFKGILQGLNQKSEDLAPSVNDLRTSEGHLMAIDDYQRYVLDDNYSPLDIMKAYGDKDRQIQQDLPEKWVRYETVKDIRETVEARLELDAENFRDKPNINRPKDEPNIIWQKLNSDEEKAQEAISDSTLDISKYKGGLEVLDDIEKVGKEKGIDDATITEWSDKYKDVAKSVDGGLDVLTTSNDPEKLASDTKSSYFGMLKTFLEPYKHKSALKSAQDEGVDPDRIIDPEKILTGEETVYSYTPVTKQEEFAPVTDHLVNRVFRSAEKHQSENQKPMLLALDELGSGKIEPLPRIIANSRKLDLAIVGGFQNISQMEERYGKDGAGNILDNTSVKLFMRTGDPKTQEYMSNAVGLQDRNNTARTYNEQNQISSSSSNRSQGRLMPAENTGFIHDGQAVVRIQDRPAAYVDLRPAYNDPSLNKHEPVSEAVRYGKLPADVLDSHNRWEPAKQVREELKAKEKSAPAVDTHREPEVTMPSYTQPSTPWREKWSTQVDALRGAWRDRHSNGSNGSKISKSEPEGATQAAASTSRYQEQRHQDSRESKDRPEATPPIKTTHEQDIHATQPHTPSHEPKHPEQKISEKSQDRIVNKERVNEPTKIN